MIHLLVLFFVSTLAVTQNEASNAQGTLSNRRIGRPTTAQLPVVNTQSQQFNKNRRRRRTKKIKGKTENSGQHAQQKGINTGRVQGGDSAEHVSRSNSNTGNLEENDAATSYSSMTDDDWSVFLSKDPTFDGSLSLNDNNNGDNEDDKPDWVKINNLSENDEWSIVDDVFEIKRGS